MNQSEFKHYVTSRTLLGVVIFIVIISFTQIIVVELIVEDVRQNTRSIAAIEKKDRIDQARQIENLHIADAQAAFGIGLTHQSEYRICYRQMVTRGYIVLHERRDKNSPYPPLKLYDCRPNMYGSEAKLLSPKARHQFLNYVNSGRAS